MRNQAERDLSKAIEVDPENCYLHYERAVVRALLGEKAAAREDRVRCHELGFDLIAFYVNHLNLEKQTMARGNPVVVKREVIPHLTSYLKIIPEHVGMLELRAQAFQMVGEPDKAARDRRRLQQVNPFADSCAAAKGTGLAALVLEDREGPFAILIRGEASV